jgi:hypothetical protein
MKTDNSSFVVAEQFRYLGTALINQNSIHEEIKSRLNQGMFAVIRCRISGIPVCYPKISRYTEL